MLRVYSVSRGMWDLKSDNTLYKFDNDDDGDNDSSGGGGDDDDKSTLTSTSSPIL